MNWETFGGLVLGIAIAMVWTLPLLWWFNYTNDRGWMAAWMYGAVGWIGLGIALAIGANS